MTITNNSHNYPYIKNIPEYAIIIFYIHKELKH